MEAPLLNPVKIMLIGDSITEGADSNGSYRRYLDGMLRRDGHLIDFVGSRRKHSDDKTEPDNYEYDVDHEGHWGKSSAWMAENMQSLLASNVPDVAVIHLGTEDIISSKVAAEPLADGIVKNIGKVVDTLRARNGNMNIVLSAIIPVAGKQDVVNLVNLKISRYVQCNATLLHPVVLADPYKGFDVSRDLAADGAHPNAAGAGKMARVFADAIHNMLGSAERKTLSVGSVGAPFELKDGEALTWRVFIDKNLVEVFANDRQADVKTIETVSSNTQGPSRPLPFVESQMGEILFCERHPGRDYSQHYYANIGYDCGDPNYKPPAPRQSRPPADRGNDSFQARRRMPGVLP
jgi:lysophospholipase L1-like esterase